MPTDSRTRAEFVLMLAGIDPQEPHLDADPLPEPQGWLRDQGFRPFIFIARKEHNELGRFALAMADDLEPTELLSGLQAAHDVICATIERATLLLGVDDDSPSH